MAKVNKQQPGTTIFARLFSPNAQQASTPNYTAGFGASTRTGESVSGTTALHNSTVFSCINVIADAVAQLDWGTVRYTDGQMSNVRLPSVEAVLKKPNDISTPYELKHAIVANILTYGNAYLLVTRSSAGQVISLTPLDPSRMKPGVNAAGRAVFEYGSGAESRSFRPGSIIHFKDFALNTVQGLSRVEQCADLVAQANAIENLTADMFKHGNGLSGIITSDQSIPPEIQNDILSGWQENFGGQRGKNRNGIAVMGGGLEFTQLNPLKPADADLQNLKRLVIAQICGVFRVPTQYIELGDNNKYNNVSQKQTSFFRDTIAPMVRNIEERLTAALINDPDVYIRFDVTDIQRGDMQTQMNIAVAGVANGILTPNEAREYLEMNPVDDEVADRLRTESNNGPNATTEE